MGTTNNIPMILLSIGALTDQIFMVYGDTKKNINFYNNRHIMSPMYACAILAINKLSLIRPLINTKQPTNTGESNTHQKFVQNNAQKLFFGAHMHTELTGVTSHLFTKV